MEKDKFPTLSITMGPNKTKLRDELVRRWNSFEALNHVSQCAEAVSNNVGEDLHMQRLNRALAALRQVEGRG